MSQPFDPVAFKAQFDQLTETQQQIVISQGTTEFLAKCTAAGVDVESIRDSMAARVSKSPFARPLPRRTAQAAPEATPA